MQNAILIADTMEYIWAIDMIGKCDQCGLENVEITVVKSDRNKQLKFCNQCKPTDGAYGY
jgi:transcription elongation factor Elf1